MVNERIGVYICHCGGNISDYVDVAKVREAIENEPGVVVARTMMFTCSDSSQQMMIDDIKKYKLDAMVVASCSPKLHELTFRGVAIRAGLNPYKYVQVNIREQCSWAHSDDPKGATEKAIRLVKAGIAKARYAEELKPIEIEAVPSVLVVGGGIAGMEAAIKLADAGINVYLIEKTPFLGGRVAQWDTVFPSGRRGIDIVKKLFEEIKKRDNITVFTNAELISKGGCVGDFQVKIRVNPRYVLKNCDKFDEAIKACPVEVDNDFDFGLSKRKAIYKSYPEAYPELPAIDMDACTKCGECLKVCGDAIDLEQKPEEIELNVGAIIVATGFDPYIPKEGEYGYKKFKNVVTLYEMERILARTNEDKLVVNGREIKNIVFIYCVGSRQVPTGEGRVNEYCSRYCCTATMHMALQIKSRFKDIKMYHLYRDIRTYGKYEIYYDRAGRNGNIFIRYSEYDPPKVVSEDGKLKVVVKDLLTSGEELEIYPDLIVLVTGMVPRNDKLLNEVLKLPIGRDGFYNEIHPKLRPVETVIDGVFIAGTSQGPKTIVETVMSALSAVSKAEGLLIRRKVELEPLIALINEEKCEWCGKCLEACPYGAIEKVSKDGKEVAHVIEALCKGCGGCMPECPLDAIELRGYTDKQIMSMIEALGKGVVR